jgi:hypothetical protein
MERLPPFLVLSVDYNVLWLMPLIKNELLELDVDGIYNNYIATNIKSCKFDLIN